MSDTVAMSDTTSAPASESSIHFRLAAARRMLYRNGCDSWVAGHVSARAEQGEDAFWVTPLQYFDETLPEHVIKVGFDMEKREGAYDSSPAVAFHAAIYQSRPDVNSVIHTHSDSVAKLATTPEPLGMYHITAVFFHEAVAHYDVDVSMDEGDGKSFAHALGDAKALILPNHGSIVVGDSLENTTIETMIFEQAARYHVAAKLLGGRELPEHEVLRLKESFKRFYRQEMWEANVRRLRRSDPDLFATA